MYHTVTWICEDFDGLGSGISKYIEHFDNHWEASMLYSSLTETECYQDDEGYPISYNRTNIELTTTDDSIPELRSVEVVIN